jgi:hypothetical protein
MILPLFENSIEALAETTKKAVGELASATPALEELFRRFDSTENEELLSELVTKAVDQRRSLIKDKLIGSVTEQEVVDLASKYLDMQWARTRWLTDYIVANLISAVISEQRHRLGWGKKLLRWLLPPLWTKVTSAAISVLIFLLLLGLCSFFFNEHSVVLGCIVIAIMLSRYIGGFLFSLKMRSFFGTLTFIANEINSGSYDREEMIRRLRKLDHDWMIRFAIPSLVYSLLRLVDPPMTQNLKLMP